MDNARELLEQIDSIKEKITDGEYLDIVKTLTKISKVENDFYKIKVIHPVATEEIESQDGDVDSTTEIHLKETTFIAKFKAEFIHENIAFFMMKDINKLKNGEMISVSYSTLVSLFEDTEMTKNLIKDGEQLSKVTYCDHDEKFISNCCIKYKTAYVTATKV